MFRVLDIYIIQDFSLWFYYFLGVAFNFTMNPKFFKTMTQTYVCNINQNMIKSSHTVNSK